MHYKNDSSFKTMSVFNPSNEKVTSTFISVKDGLKLPDLNKTAVFNKRSMSLTQEKVIQNQTMYFAPQSLILPFKQDGEQTFDLFQN